MRQCSVIPAKCPGSNIKHGYCSTCLTIDPGEMPHCLAPVLRKVYRLEVCGSTRTRGYTRTRPVPAGMGRVRVDVLRVGSGTGT